MLCIVTASFTDVNAQDAKACPHSYAKDTAMLSKESASIPFFKASATNAILFVGATSAAYKPLTFTRHKHLHGDGIKPKKNGFEFSLEKGSYQIAFTGTFQATVGNICLIDLALRVGSEVIAVNTNSIEVNFDSFQILTTSQIVHLDKKTKVSVVSRNRAVATTAQVLQRSISIIKLD